MIIFLKSIDERIWLAFEIDPFKPTIVDATTKQHRPKTRDEWDNNDLVNMSFNNKALYFITSGLCFDEHRRISICKTAKEAWDILVTTHEGTATIKKF